MVSTQEQDVAYYYDAGLRMAAEADRTAGRQHGIATSRITIPRAASAPRPRRGPEREPVKVKYRTLAFKLAHGAIAVFPAPHQYFFARDFTTNMGYLWHRSWRGEIALGVRQLPDDNSPYYPWMNAPPGTAQRMSVFFLLDDRAPRAVLDDVLRYTHSDRFVPLPGFKTVAPHWHYAYTVQAMEKGVRLGAAVQAGAEGHGRGCGHDHGVSRRRPPARSHRSAAEGTGRHVPRHPRAVRPATSC